MLQATVLSLALGMTGFTTHDSKYQACAATMILSSSFVNGVVLMPWRT